jgi:hypothetical protein
MGESKGPRHVGFRPCFAVAKGSPLPRGAPIPRSPPHSPCRGKPFNVAAGRGAMAPTAGTRWVARAPPVPSAKVTRMLGILCEPKAAPCDGG